MTTSSPAAHKFSEAEALSPRPVGTAEFREL